MMVALRRTPRFRFLFQYKKLKLKRSGKRKKGTAYLRRRGGCCCGRGCITGQELLKLAGCFAGGNRRGGGRGTGARGGGGGVSRRRGGGWCVLDTAGGQRRRGLSAAGSATRAVTRMVVLSMPSQRTRVAIRFSTAVCFALIRFLISMRKHMPISEIQKIVCIKFYFISSKQERIRIT